MDWTISLSQLPQIEIYVYICIYVSLLLSRHPAVNIKRGVKILVRNVGRKKVRKPGLLGEGEGEMGAMSSSLLSKWIFLHDKANGG